MYIYNYASGGFLKAILYIVLIAMTLNYYLKVIKEKRKLSLIASFCSTVILIAGLTEDDPIIGLSGNGILTRIDFLTSYFSQQAYTRNNCKLINKVVKAFHTI